MFKKKEMETGCNQNIWVLDGTNMRRQLRRVQAVISYLDIEPRDIVIDIGCGEGFITSHLSKAGFVIGIDISKTALLKAKQKIKKTNVCFILADATALPIKIASLDKITLLEILEHLTEENQKLLLDQVDKILKAKGTLLISVPYKEKITCVKSVSSEKLTPMGTSTFF